jgi:hypothetical protein
MVKRDLVPQLTVDSDGASTECGDSEPEEHLEHPPLCDQEEVVDEACEVCGLYESCNDNLIVLCNCGVGYHQKCHNPPLTDSDLEGEWKCPTCSAPGAAI